MLNSHRSVIYVNLSGLHFLCNTAFWGTLFAWHIIRVFTFMNINDIKNHWTKVKDFFFLLLFFLFSFFLIFVLWTYYEHWITCVHKDHNHFLWKITNVICEWEREREREAFNFIRWCMLVISFHRSNYGSTRVGGLY